MKYYITILPLILTGCFDTELTQEGKDAHVVEEQQAQYAKGQPIPKFNWSLERDLILKLYIVRNQKASTHSVWRSDRGMIEGDCPSYGYGVPYDTSLTNPLTPSMRYVGRIGGARKWAEGVVEQAEPNGIFASKNTAATWVMCLGQSGQIEPVYVETKVTVYPGPVNVDYDTNRVKRSGAATILINK